MKFVVKHPTKVSWLRAPRFIGDRVQWTESEPISARQPWLFATREGANRARDMHALDGSVEPWYEAGDRAPAAMQPDLYRRAYEAAFTPPVNDTGRCATSPQDYTLPIVLAELAVVEASGSSGCDASQPPTDTGCTTF